MDDKFCDAPIQLVLIREDGIFEITVEGINFLSSLKNKKIAIMTITGPNNTGKSFLANLFMDRTTGFKLNSMVSNTPTKGIWAWGKPMILSDGTLLVIIDSEGINSNDKDREKVIDTKIFILEVLMSTLILYNTKNSITEELIEDLSFLSDLKQKINILKTETEGFSTRSTTIDVKSLNDYFPHFVWVLRDFVTEKKPNEYLEQVLDEFSKKNDSKDIIRSNFKNRDCFVLSPPIQEDKLKNLENEPISHLKSEFLLQLETLISFVKNNILPKQIGNFVLDGKDLFGLIQNYIEYLNNDENPVIISALENLLLSKAKEESEKTQENFNKQFSEPFVSKLPLDVNEIYKEFYQVSDDFLQKFCESLNDNLTSKQIGDRIITLLNKMRDQLENILETNATYNDELYQDAYDEITKSIENKSLTKIEDLNSFIINFISDWKSKLEKFFEFTKGDSKNSYIMKILLVNIFSKIKQLGIETFDIYSNIQKDSSNQIENLKINLKKNDELLVNEKKKNEELTKEKSELFAKNIDLESKLGRMERELKNNKKELDEMLKIEEQKLQNIRNTNDTSILEKERIISQLEKKVDHFEKQLADVNKEFSVKLIESEKEVTKLLVQIERNKQSRPNSLKANDPKDYKLNTLKTVFDSIQNIFSDLKESVDKLDRDKEKMFKSKFLDFSTRELDNKSKIWLDELKQFKAEQIKLITEEYEKTIMKLKDELEQTQSLLMQSEIKIEEEIQAKENYKNKYEDALKEASSYQQISITKENIISKQKEMAEFSDEKICNLLKIKEDLEIKLSHAIINSKMREDELETLLIVVEGLLAKKKEKYDHNIKKLSYEVKRQIEDLVKNFKIFKF